MMESVSRASVKVDIERSEIREFLLPPVGDNDGLLKVEASGVGGSDPEMYRKENTAPCIMGHENVGTVAKIGDAAARRWGIGPGDRIALHEYLPCWHCHWCRQGDFRLCMEVDFFNVKDRFNTLRYGTCNADIPPHLWGGFSEYMYLAPNAVIHKIPADMDARLATLAVPLGNGVQWAVLDGCAGLGKTVLVFGPGQQGLSCALAAKQVLVTLAAIIDVATETIHIFGHRNIPPCIGMRTGTACSVLCRPYARFVVREPNPRFSRNSPLCAPQHECGSTDLTVIAA